jgi:hypothetical protein
VIDALYIAVALLVAPVNMLLLSSEHYGADCNLVHVERSCVDVGSCSWYLFDGSRATFATVRVCEARE